MNDIRPTLPPRRAGLLEATVQKLFTRSASVVEIVEIGRAFRIITLRGGALRNVAWTPGDKIQLQLGGWTQRTYTPLDWDAVHGRTRILVHLHADGPGTQWARTVKKGDACVVFGPRKSITLAQSRAPVIVFGDETSLGVAAAIAAHGQAPAVQVLLEVSSLAETTPVIAQLGLIDPRLYERRDDDSHLRDLEAEISTALMQDPAADIVLTGRAGALVQMTRFLRQTGAGSGRRHTKAYWASGKTGLD
jgi:NADPH-dependent ferric siderophore reductase